MNFVDGVNGMKYFSRFFAGTLIVEPITKQLGTFFLTATKHSIFPACPLISKTVNAVSGIGYSTAKGRFVVLILASILHSLFFVIVGFKPGFDTILVAYAIAAFARAFLTGKQHTFSSSRHLTVFPQPCCKGFFQVRNFLFQISPEMITLHQPPGNHWGT